MTLITVVSDMTSCTTHTTLALRITHTFATPITPLIAVVVI